MSRELGNILFVVLFLLLRSDLMAQGSKGADLKRGAAVYEQNCASCHQKDGNGVPRLIPPLTGTDYVSGDKTRLIRILLQGLNERILVQEEEYYSPMASFQQLTDRQIADVLTYIRARFGDGASPIRPEQVGSVRKKLKK
jgi:mono/diheme cytochrome c family protein